MYVSIIEPVGSYGGMDYYDYGLAYGLGENQAHVTLYTCAETQIRSFKNVKTALVFGDLWRSSFFKKTYLYLKGHVLAYKDSKVRGAKIVHLHFFSCRSIDLLVIVLAKLWRLKVIVTVHDVNSFNINANRIFERFCYKLMDGVIVHNNSSYEDLKNKGFGIKRMAIIPHGNYLPFINEIDNREKNHHEFTLLFFGQIKEIKGLDVMLKALAIVTNQNKNVKLIVAGRAYQIDLANYESIIHELKLSPFIQTDFRYIPDNEVHSLFNKADIVVLPYKEIYQSGVLLLAMSYGKPLICSGLEAFKEIITDEDTGFIFKNGDTMDLANTILKVIDNPQLLNKVSLNASRLIKTKFDWVNIGFRTKEFYRLVTS